VATVLYPGSFDPFHNGHQELVETASHLFDRVVIAAIRNPQKSAMLFELEERQELIRDAVRHLENIEVVAMSKLVVDVAKDVGADFIIKGLRAVSDFENEMAQAQTNLTISGVHTLFLPSASANSYLASKYIREIARFGGAVSAMVSDAVVRSLKEKFGQ
jgi:pantetheine-phosphate adenylyltransferase